MSNTIKTILLVIATIGILTLVWVSSEGRLNELNNHECQITTGTNDCNLTK